MSSSDQNLKSQLSDLQKRLSQSTISSPSRKPPRGDIHRTDNSSTNNNDPKRSTGEASKKGLSNFLTKKDKRVSLPVFDSSSNSLSSQSKAGGKDMDFVVGLSENLLVECRRLQAENQSKSNRLRSVEEEIEKIKISNSSLLAKLNETLQEEEKYRDANWELETKLQQLTQDFKTVTDSYNKSQAELNKQLEFSNEIRSELDEMNLNKETLEKDFTSHKATNTNQVQDLKSHIDELNDENYKLNNEIDEMRKKLEESQKKPADTQIKNIPVLRPLDDESSDEEYKEPPLSPVKTIPVNNTALESETLRGSLSQAHHTIAKLRAQILKLRSNELSSKQNSPIANKKSQTPILKKSIRSLNEPGNRSFHVLKPSSNRSSKNIYDDSMDTTEYDDDWENFEGDTSQSQQSPTQRKLRPVSLSQDLIEDSESDFDENVLADVAPLSSELKVLTEEDIEQYAEEHGLVILPGDQYSRLIGQDLTDDAIITPAKMFGFVSLPNDDPAAKQQAKEVELQSFAEAKGLVLLDKQELAAKEEALDSGAKQITELVSQISDLRVSEEQYVKEATEFKKQLEEAEANALRLNSEKSALDEQLQNPSRDFVQQKAEIHGLHVLPLVDFKSIQADLSSFKLITDEPSHDFLMEKSKSKNLTLLRQDEHSDLLSQISSLQEKLSSKEKEIVDLEDELSHTSEDLKSKTQEIASLYKERDQLKSDIADLDEQNKSLLLNAQELESIITSLKERVTSGEKEISELTTKHTDVTNTLLALQSSFDEPSHDYMYEKASSRGLKLLDVKDHDKQLADHESTVSDLKEQLSNLNLKISDLEKDVESKSTEVASLSTRATSLQKSIDEPSHDYINEKAGARGFRVLEINTHDRQLEELNSSIASLKTKLESEKEKSTKNTETSNKLVAGLKEKVEMLETELQSLRETNTKLTDELEQAKGNLSILRSEAENPTHEYLSEKATKQGLTVLPKLAHVSLLERANRSIHDLAKEDNSVVLSQADHAELKSLAHEPSLDHLVSKVDNHNHKVVPVEEFDALSKKANTTVEELAESKGLTLVSNEDYKDITQRLENPTLDTLHDHLSTYKYVAIPEGDHQSLLERSKKTAEDLAKEKDHVVISNEDHKELVRKAGSPSVDELRLAAYNHNHVLVPSDEHDALVTKAYKNIKDLATEQDHVALPKKDYEELNRKVSKPSIAELVALSTGLGYIALHKDSHSDLVQKSERSVHDLAKEQDFVAIPKSEHEGLLSAIETPSIEYLATKGTSSGHQLVKDEEFKQLTERANKTIHDHAKEQKQVVVPEDDYNALINPSEELVATNAKLLGLVTVSKERYDDLVALSKSPKLDFINEKAAALGYIVVDSGIYDNLVKLSESPSKDFIRQKATSLGLIAIPSLDYNNLKEETTKLKKDFADKKLLAEKVSSDGSVVLKREDYDDLVTKASTAIEDLAASEGKVVVTKEDYESLVNPSADAISTHATRHNLIAVPKDTHRALLHDHETPSLEHLITKAATHGHLVIPQGDHESMKQSLESPSLKYLTEKAASHGSVLIASDDLNELNSKASRTIDDLAKEHNKVVLSEKDHNELVNPSIDSLKTHIANAGLIHLPKEEHETLRSTVNEPSLNFLHDKAKTHSYVLVHEKELKDLQDHKENPSQEYLSTRAGAYGLTLVPLIDYEGLKEHAKKSIDELAAEKGLVAISSEEHESLINPDKEALTAKAKIHNLVLVDAQDYDNLLNPSTEALEKNANEIGLTIIPVESLKDLESKASRSVDDLAKDSDKVVVSKDEHASFLSPSVEKLGVLASALGLVALSKDELSTLNNPSVDKLREWSDSHGLVIVQKDELSEITQKSNRTIDDLAKESNSVVLSQDDHSSLLNPAKESVIEHAAKHGLVTLTSEDHAALLHPSKDVLSVHADREGFKLLPARDYEALVHPNKEAIVQKARENGLVAVDKADYESLENSSQSPSIEHITEKANGLGLVVIPTEEHDVLEKTVKAPTVEHLTQKANDLNLKVIPVSEHDRLQSLAHSPDRDHITSKAKDLGLHVLPFDDHKSLETKAVSPSADHLSEKAALLGLTVLSAREHKQLKDLVENPTLDLVKTGANNHKFLLVDETKVPEFVDSHLTKNGQVSLPKDEHSKLKDVDTLEIKDLEPRISDLGFVAVDQATYDKLNADISKGELITLAKNFGFKAVPLDEYEKLASGPTDEELKTLSESRNLSLIPNSDYNALLAQVEQPDKSFIDMHANKFGCVVITEKEYRSLDDAAHKISKNDLEAKARKIDHVLIPTEEYEQFKSVEEDRLQKNPSTPQSKVAMNKDYFENIHKSAEKETHKAKVFESARTLGFVPVAADEYKQLLERQKDYVMTKSDVYKGAKDFNLAVLPFDEYRGLLKNRSNRDSFSFDDLQAIAKRFNLSLVTVNRSEEDTRSPKSPKAFTLQTNESTATFSSNINESEFTDALERMPSNASTIRDTSEPTVSESELRVQANRLGFTLVPVGEVSDREVAPQLANDEDDSDADDEDDHDNTITNRSHILNPPGRDEITRRAGELGLVVIEENEFESLKSKELSPEDLTLEAQKMGLSVLETDRLQRLESLQTPDEAYIREASKGLGLVALSSSEIKDIEQTAAAKVNTSDIITEDNIQEYANNMGLILLTRERFDELVESSVTTQDGLVKKADEFNFVAVEAKELEALQSKATSGDSMSKGEGLSKSAILAGASALGLSVLSAKELASNKTPEAPTEASLRSYANDLGFHVLSGDEYASLSTAANKQFSESDASKFAANNGSENISKTALDELKEKASRKLSRDELVSKSEEFGLIPVPSGEYRILKAASNGTNTPLLSKSDVVSRALEFDLVAVSKEELDDLREKAGARRSELSEADKTEPPAISKEQVESSAKLHGLLAIPENSFIATNISRIPDVNNVVVLPITYYNKLTKSESMNIDKISNEELQVQAKKRGFHITYGDPEVAREQNTLTRKSTVTSLATSNSRRNLAEAAASAAYQDYEAQSRTTSRSASRAHSINRSGSATNIHQRDVSIDGGISLMTTASLSEPNIIPALTQTVIGEYLHKYYRRLGPLSSISESRHERYFWIHPYTLTLYWSSTNPVLGNPSTHKTRAAAIIGVESVDDNNPLPAGLYHKSIIVHSQTRSVKITCPTRQRHNIWYNSLRYLIQRSMDGIILEDDLDLLKENNPAK